MPQSVTNIGAGRHSVMRAYRVLARCSLFAHAVLRHATFERPRLGGAYGSARVDAERREERQRVRNEQPASAVCLFVALAGVACHAQALPGEYYV